VYECENLTVEGVATHFASSDSLTRSDIEFTNMQNDRFLGIIDALKKRGYNVGKLHSQSSYGVLNYPGLICDYARVGMALLGVLSGDPDTVKKYNLKPILSLRACIAQVRRIGAGESVSYGRNFTTDKPMKLATVNIGYADGIARNISGKSFNCIVHGKKVPIVGRICMDFIMLDVTQVETAEAGDIVTLIGRDGDEVIRCEDLASAADTITNEIFSRLGIRLPRVYLP
jgi:serine/alanine racemase